MTFPAYVAILILLIVVEMVGFVGKGAQRWVDLGFIRLQPSEFMKPAIVLVLARFYDLLPAGEIRRWRALWPAAAADRRPAVLILVQPDLGTAMMVAAGRRHGDVPRRPAAVVFPGRGRRGRRGGADRCSR